MSDADARDHARLDDLAAVRLLQRGAAISNEATSFNDALEAAMNEVCSYTGWPVAHAYIPVTGQLDPTQLWYLEDPERFENFRRVTEATPLRPGIGLPGRILDSGKPAWIVDVLEDDNFPRARMGVDIVVRGAFGFPVLAWHDVVAVLEFFSDRPEPPDDRLLDLVANVGTQLGRVAERESAATSLMAQVEHTRVLLDSAYEAFVSIDTAGLVTAWNAAAETTFGWTRSEVIGRHLTETIIPPRYREAHLRGIEHYLKTGEGPVLNKRLELTALHRDGREFPIELAIWPVLSQGEHTFCAFIRDISQQKLAEQRLRESERRLLEAQSIARIGSWLWDIESRTVTWSDQLYRNFHLEPDSFIPTFDAYIDRIHPDDRERVRATIGRALETHVFPDFEHRALLPSGGERIHLCKGEVVVSDGRAVRMVGTSQDITERKTAELVLQTAYDREREMVDKLRQLDADRTNFVSSVSHELRTPLTSILGYLELLTLGDEELQLTTKQLGMLEVVNRNAARLMDLIEDLLTVSRLEAGTFGMSIAPTDLEPIIASARDAVQPAASESGVDLIVSVPENLGVVMGDAGQLERAILNVLSNAIKFTPAGGSVHLDAKRENSQLLVEVQDTGVGISSDDLPKLFRPFFRSSSTYKQAVPGTGLGLVIVKSILEGHHGSVDVSSAPGEGTTVTLRIPAVAA